MKILGAMVLCSGCYFHAVPVETKSTRFEREERTIEGECRVETFAIETTTTTKQARFEGGPDLGSGGVVENALLFVPVLVVATAVGAVSGVVTGVEVAVDRTERREGPRKRLTTKSCSGRAAVGEDHDG